MNVLGVGLEIVSHEDFLKKIGKNGKDLLGKIFTVREQQYCSRKRNSHVYYSARWACKVAVLRVLGLSLRSPYLKGVQVEAGSDGRPSVWLDRKIASKKIDWQIHDIKVSLSHSSKFSVADVIVLGEVKSLKVKAKNSGIINDT